MRLLVILNEGFQNNRLYTVGMKNKFGYKLIPLSLTKLSYELMVVTILASETVVLWFLSVRVLAGHVVGTQYPISAGRIYNAGRHAYNIHRSAEYYISFESIESASGTRQQQGRAIRGQTGEPG